MADYQVLATSATDATFLITPSGPDYISTLRVIKMVASSKPLRLAEVDLKQVEVSQKSKGFWSWLFSTKRTTETESSSLYEAMTRLKQRFKCDI